MPQINYKANDGGNRKTVVINPYKFHLTFIPYLQILQLFPSVKPAPVIIQLRPRKHCSTKIPYMASRTLVTLYHNPIQPL